MRLGAYVHFPYCRAICPYCNFNVHVARDIPHRAYADAVLAEARARAPEAGARPPVSIYFGGGTPGLWAADAVARVVDGLAAAFGLVGEAEITLEANADFLDAARLRAFRAAGVNRLSLGVQSLRASHLRVLGRLHDADDARRALGDALAAGFRSVNADFLCALPGQDLSEWVEDLAGIAAMGVPHLSIYALTVEEGTPLAAWVERSRLELPAEEVQADQLLAADSALRAAGYEHYEVSNFARPGHRAIHNSLYWMGHEYLGLGAGAHGFLRVEGGGARWADHDRPERYMAEASAGRLPEAWREPRTPGELADEALMTNLRWLDGVDFDEFQARTGRDLRETHASALEALAAEGLVDADARRLRLTTRGFLLLNVVTLRLFSCDSLTTARGAR